LIGHSWWARALIPLAFCLSVMAGIGMDTVLRKPERQRATRWAIGTFGGIVVVLGLIWLFGRGHLPAYAAHIRESSFVWPAVSTAVGLIAFGALLLIDRRSVGKESRPRTIRWAAFGVAGLLLICQTVFLVVDDAPIPSSSSTMYPTTPAIATVQRVVGSNVVGLDNPGFFGGLGLGFSPNTNLPYDVDEFAEYDPIAPASFFSDWTAINQTLPGVPSVYEFDPGIATATVARRYGISYVLTPHGHPGPTGGVFITRAGNEDLYRIPGVAIATLVPETSSTDWPSTDAPGAAVAVKWPSPTEVRIVTDSSSPTVLRLRVTSIPGWHATIDGQPLPLATYLSMMFQVHVPAGKHVIVLRYWPKRFTDGLVIAACAVIGLVVAGLITWRRRTRAPIAVEPPG
jgi:hypothetical protein